MVGVEVLVGFEAVASVGERFGSASSGGRDGDERFGGSCLHDGVGVVVCDVGPCGGDSLSGQRASGAFQRA